MNLRQTHTFATLEVSVATYEEIATKLKAAGYDQAIFGTDKGILIDMHGIALAQDPKDLERLRAPAVKPKLLTAEEAAAQITKKYGKGLAVLAD